MAGDVFQERPYKVLRGIPYIHNIADYILIHGPAKVPHDISIISLLETERANNININTNRFVFKPQDYKLFLGNLTPNGYNIDPKKIQTITEMSSPQHHQDLQSYLGLANYLSHFGPRLAELTAPLIPCSKRDTLYTWENSQQAAFAAAVKTEIINAPILVYFNKSKPNIIQSDASRKGLGAVLLQDGKLVVYASRSLTETDQCYSHIERERAIKCCVCT